MKRVERNRSLLRSSPVECDSSGELVLLGSFPTTRLWDYYCRTVDVYLINTVVHLKLRNRFTEQPFEDRSLSACGWKSKNATARTNRGYKTELRIAITFWPFAGAVEVKVAHSSINRRRLSNRSPRRYAASVSLPMACASAISRTSLG